MIVHIVKPNETIDKISKQYNVSIDEIKSANAHFRSWEHLAPGAKIKLPEIPEHISDEIDLIEPFIEDYYPELTSEVFKEKNIDELKEKSEIEEKLNASSTSKTKMQKYYKYPYFMYYGYPYYRKR